MGKIKCCIKIGELPLHLYQITAGFHLLHKNGIIDLSIEKQNKILPSNMMEVILDSKLKILYDLNDGYDNQIDSSENYKNFIDNLLREYDICFKRSFNSLINKDLIYGNKIHPLGLNYMVTTPRNIAHFPQEEDSLREKVKKMIRMIPFTEFYNGNYYIKSFEDVPRLDKIPKILFIARLWDSNAKEIISKEKQEEREYINEFRANCIRAVRKEFRNNFFGGIMLSDYAIKYCPDIVIHDRKITKRNNYINIVKQSSICIATMGLHRSTGWKFAEYISASKAIVTEEQYYEATGDLKEGDNFLTFNSPVDCINQINELVNDENYRYKMMINNFEYYNKFVKPDQLILNTIITALKKLNNREIFNETITDHLYSYI